MADKKVEKMVVDSAGCSVESLVEKMAVPTVDK